MPVLQKLRDQAASVAAKSPPGTTVSKDPRAASASKDANIEADIARAKAHDGAAMKVAAAELLNGWEEQRTKTAMSKTLTNDEKRKHLEALAQEKTLLEAGVSLPKSAFMRASLKSYEDAVAKPRQTLATTMDATANAYLGREDTGNAQVLIAEKKRLLMRPNSIDLLALVDVKQDSNTGLFLHQHTSKFACRSDT